MSRKRKLIYPALLCFVLTVFADMWLNLVGDVKSLTKDIGDQITAENKPPVYVSLPRPGVWVPYCLCVSVCPSVCLFAFVSCLSVSCLFDFSFQLFTPFHFLSIYLFVCLSCCSFMVSFRNFSVLPKFLPYIFFKLIVLIMIFLWFFFYTHFTVLFSRWTVCIQNNSYILMCMGNLSSCSVCELH